MIRTCDKQSAFTLAELLIALAILGVIATFTIPKILDSGSNAQYNSMTKEVMAMMSGAFQNLKLNGGLSTQTNSGDLTPYMNYVSVITTGEQIQVPLGAWPCDANRPCYQLHNGGWIRLYSHPQREFGGSSNTNIITMMFDPDGNNTAVGLEFFITYNGRITSSDGLQGGYEDSDSPWTFPRPVPAWLDWSN